MSYTHRTPELRINTKQLGQGTCIQVNEQKPPSAWLYNRAKVKHSLA